MAIEQVHIIRFVHRRMSGRGLHELLEPVKVRHGIEMVHDALFDQMADHQSLAKRSRRRVMTTGSMQEPRKWPDQGPGPMRTG